MTQEMIALVAGFVISILVEVIPRFKTVWSKWKWQRASLLGLFVVVALGAWTLSCTADLIIPGIYLCTMQGVLDTLIMGLVAFTGSQATYLVFTRQSANAKLRHQRSAKTRPPH